METDGQFADWERWQTCTRKKRFMEEPTIHADYLPGVARPYRCRFCAGWHLTSKPLNGRQKREREMRAAPKPSL